MGPHQGINDNNIVELCLYIAMNVYLREILLIPVTRTICSRIVSVVGFKHWKQTGQQSEWGFPPLHECYMGSYHTSMVCSVQSAPACLRVRSTFTACLVMVLRNSLLQQVCGWSSPNLKRKKKWTNSNAGRLDVRFSLQSLTSEVKAVSASFSWVMALL